MLKDIIKKIEEIVETKVKRVKSFTGISRSRWTIRSELDYLMPGKWEPDYEPPPKAQFYAEKDKILGLRFENVDLDLDELFENKKHWRHLEYLVIRSCGAWDLSPLKILKNLQGIDIRGMSIKDIEPLAELKKLKIIKLISATVKNISPLKNLTEVTVLNISNEEDFKLLNRVSDISAITQMTELEKFYASKNKIQTIPDLSALQNLKILELGSNEIRDVEGLKNLQNLKELVLERNKIKDITPLSNLKKLKTLDLYQNKITDISPLENIRTLRDLNIAENKIKDLRPLKKLYLKKSSQISIWSNPLKYPSPFIAEGGKDAIVEWFKGETWQKSMQLFFCGPFWEDKIWLCHKLDEKSGASVDKIDLTKNNFFAKTEGIDKVHISVVMYLFAPYVLKNNNYIKNATNRYFILLIRSYKHGNPDSYLAKWVPAIKKYGKKFKLLLVIFLPNSTFYDHIDTEVLEKYPEIDDVIAISQETGKNIDKFYEKILEWIREVND